MRYAYDVSTMSTGLDYQRVRAMTAADPGGMAFWKME